MQLRQTFLVLSLAGLAVGGIFNYIDSSNLKKELLEVAKPQIIDYLQFDPSIRVVGFETTTSKKYLFWGQPFGKVALYIAANDAGDKERYVGYTFYYEKNGEKWSMTESGACSGTECQIRGRQLDHKK
ncbi:MAG TPA: hypothetical protein PKY35_00685 [Candidatus Hydrogenedentes bacterium]|nr:hypothetical protein [Candidatus Hydrogenedentota bacterium]HOL75518.1 hypothetical protein [Candidatus Hydrogenedentota bacterium]HPO86040.1 hypothetical protein [Candidatus Hydrogenedentota bacterium]